MTFERIACFGLFLFLSFGSRPTLADRCIIDGPQYRLQPSSTEGRMHIHGAQSCTRAVRLNKAAFHSINLTSPAQPDRTALLGSGFATPPMPGFRFQSEHSSAGVSGPVRQVNETSLVRIASNRPPTRNDSVEQAAFQRDHRMLQMNKSRFEDWSARWEQGMIAEQPSRYCTTAMGEEIGWLLGPIFDGYYYGYQATHDAKWIDLLIMCADAWIKRAVREPDGYLGWPKFGAAGTDVDHLNDFFADSMLGEAMALRPITQMASKIIGTPTLAERYNARAAAYIKLSEQIFDKWNSRGAWREINANEMISIYLPFGLDRTRSAWTAEYEERYDVTLGFSHQDNKANLVARWILALLDCTQKGVYRDRAEKWFRTMKSRIAPKHDGTYRIWNYWEPAGRWTTIQTAWLNIGSEFHPNGGYYDIDVEAIVAAYEHGLVFSRDDINQLVATALANKRYWTALVPYDDTIQQHFEQALDPSSWSGHSKAPWYLTLALRNGLQQ